VFTPLRFHTQKSKKMLKLAAFLPVLACHLKTRHGKIKDFAESLGAGESAGF
jgi:hypothetical protein